jgi:hypothetical protein
MYWRENIELALLWWEECRDYEDLEREIEKRFEKIDEKAMHGDEGAYLAIWLRYFDKGNEDLLSPLVNDKIACRTMAFNMIDWISMGYRIRRDVDGFLKFFLKLPHDLRREWLKDEDKYTIQKLREFVGEEVFEILSKARVELKIVLDLEEAIPLILKYREKWREKVREILRNAIKNLRT